MYFALLAAGMIHGLNFFDLLSQSAVMAVFIVFGLFGLRPAETLLGVLHIGLMPSGKPARSPTPARIGNAKVVAFTAIDRRHRPTGYCRHTVAGTPLDSVAGLAICSYDASPGYYLLYCDAQWKPTADTYHDTIEAAMQQAEFEFEGTSKSWQQLEES